MKKFILFLSLIFSGIYLVNFIGAISITKNSGEVLDNTTWSNISSLTNKIDVSGTDIKLNGKLYVTGELCSEVGGEKKCLRKKIIDKNSCENEAGWMWVDKDNDVYIGSAKGDGFCISPRFGDWNSDATNGTGGISWNGWGNNTATYVNGWNPSVLLDSKTIDDTGNSRPDMGQTKNLTHVANSPIPYSCRPLGTSKNNDSNAEDTITGRMQWLAGTGNNYTQAKSINWITVNDTNTLLTTVNGHAIPAIYIADCIDGVKDLGEDMEYKHHPDKTKNETISYEQYKTDVTANTDTKDFNNITYQNRQKYLTAWTQKPGSHLPSAFSYISDGNNLTGNTRGEYQMACEGEDKNTPFLTDSNDKTNAEKIWLSAVGYVDGTKWGRGARTMNGGGCSEQWGYSTGGRNGYYSARFIVRP